MKIILTTILLITAIWSQAQLSTNQKIQVQAMIKAATDPLWSQITWLRKGNTTDSIRINNLVTVTITQNNQISSLMSLTSTQANDIRGLQTKTNLQAIQIRNLQDSLNAIPFVLVDTVKGLEQI